MTYAVVLLLWCAAGYRGRAWRGRTRGVASGSYAAAAGFIAAAFTVKAFELRVDHVTGPFTSDLLEHLLAVFGGYSAQIFLLALRDGRTRRRPLVGRTILAAAVTAVMITAFVLAPVHRPVSGDFDELYGQLVSVAVYRLAFDGELAYVLVDVIRLCRRNGRAPGDGGRSLSLTVSGSGAAVALGYPLSRVVYITSRVIKHRSLGGLHTAGSAAASLGLFGMAVGMLTPKVIDSGRVWFNAQKELRRMHVLWSDLAATFPLMVLPVGRGLTPWTAQLRHARHLIEINEGLTMAYISGPRTREQAGQMTVFGQARLLRSNRARWASREGTPASSLIPIPTDPVKETQQILALADAYTAISKQKVLS